MYRMVISLILMLLVAIFSIQNKDAVYVTFLIWNLQIPLVILVISAATLGAVMVGLLGIVKQISMGRRIRELNGKLKKADNENTALKNRLETAERTIEEEKEKETLLPDPEGSSSAHDSKSDEGGGKNPPNDRDTIMNPTFPIRSE